MSHYLHKSVNKNGILWSQAQVRFEMDEIEISFYVSSVTIQFHLGIQGLCYTLVFTEILNEHHEF